MEKITVRQCNLDDCNQGKQKNTTGKKRHAAPQQPSIAAYSTPTLQEAFGVYLQH